MTGPAWLIEPLQGKTALTRVVWIYGLLGSVVYGAIELLLNQGDPIAMRIYMIGGVLLSIYVVVAMYRCAFNGVSRFWGRMAQISAILSLLLLPVLAYLDWTGALSLALLGEQ